MRIFENIWEWYLEVEEFVWEPWNSDLDLYYSRQQRQQSSDVIIVVIIINIIVIVIDIMTMLAFHADQRRRHHKGIWPEHHLTSHIVNFSHHGYHMMTIILHLWWSSHRHIIRRHWSSTFLIIFLFSACFPPCPGREWLKVLALLMHTVKDTDTDWTSIIASFGPWKDGLLVNEASVKAEIFSSMVYKLCSVCSSLMSLTHD